MQTADIYYMAGLLESKGHLGFEDGVPSVVMACSDLDVVEGVAKIFGSTLRGPQRRRGYHRDVWVTSIEGSKAIGWMLTLYTIFGKRSRTRVREVLNRWHKSTNPAREQVRLKIKTAN